MGRERRSFERAANPLVKKATHASRRRLVEFSLDTHTLGFEGDKRKKAKSGQKKLCLLN